jgi:hypothetical protein
LRSGRARARFDCASASSVPLLIFPSGRWSRGHGESVRCPRPSTPGAWLWDRCVRPWNRCAEPWSRSRPAVWLWCDCELLPAFRPPCRACFFHWCLAISHHSPIDSYHSFGLPLVLFFSARSERCVVRRA